MCKWVSYLLVICFWLGAQCLAAPTTEPATAATVETIVILRHGEKAAGGYGQLNSQGLNRALALARVLPEKFGKPDFLFAPDPGEMMIESGVPCNYVRPLATIEPTAIRYEMPVHTPCGFRDIEVLIDELGKPQYASATIFIAWEHAYAREAAAGLMKKFGGDSKLVPGWKGEDFDTLDVVRITRVPGEKPKVAFIHDQQGLDGQSKEMPPAHPRN